MTNLHKQWKRKPQLCDMSHLQGHEKEKVCNEPHELLKATPRIPTLAEQVENMNRLGAIKRLSALEQFPDDYYGEDIEDDIHSEGLTLYELEGSKSVWDDKSVKAQHKTPDAGVSGEKTPATTSEDKTPPSQG